MDRPAKERTVLVVDDDAILRKLVVGGLAPLGRVRILEAKDGLDAQVLLAEHSVDVVVTDLLMPGLDGLGLMRWAHAARPGSTWIILSGVDTFDAAVEAIHHGAFDFLKKPPHASELQVAVRNAFAQMDLVEEREGLLGELQSRSLELVEKVEELERTSEMVRQDLERAEVIQRALLPSTPPPLDDMHVAALARPGRHVGGDLYDVALVGDHQLVFYIADATGHGVSAAMLSVLFKQRLIRAEGGRALAPREALARVNRRIVADIDAPGLFLTAAYGLYDVQTRELSIASAGHPPVVVRREGGAVEQLERTGPALGLEAEASFDEHRLTFAAGDRLLLFTDGLLDGLGQASDEADSSAARVPERVVSALAADNMEARGRLRSLFGAATDASVSNDDRDDITMLLLDARSGESSFDHDCPEAGEAEDRSDESTGRPRVLWIAEDEQQTFLRIVGKGTWIDCDALFSRASSGLEAGRRVVVDLSACQTLDSCTLGTLHELARIAEPDRLQVVAPSNELRSLFDEMCMQRVIACAQAEEASAPGPLRYLRPGATGSRSSQRMLLRAHEALASLGPENRAKFAAVVAALKAEVEGGAEVD